MSLTHIESLDSKDCEYPLLKEVFFYLTFQSDAGVLF